MSKNEPYPMPTAPPTYDQATGHMYPNPNIGFVPQAPYNPYPDGHILPQGQPAGYPLNMKFDQPPPQTQQPTVITQRIVIENNGLAVGPKPMNTVCPHCHASIRTQTESDFLCTAHVCCGVLFLIGFWFCSCLPYFMDSCRSVSHSCPNCRKDLGTYVPS